jgi:putative phosphotransacetylase
LDREILKAVVEKVAARYSGKFPALVHPQPIPVGVSNRHVHLSEADLEVVFGKGYTLCKQRDLSQSGQYAAVETVNIAGPKGCIEKVRVLGPVRKQSQVEVSIDDINKLGTATSVRESGDLSGSPGITVIGPKGSVHLKEGLIVSKRHIHMTPSDARKFGVEDGQNVQVKTSGERGLIFDQVVVRVNDKFVLEFHIDMDEANASGLKHGDYINMITCGSCITTVQGETLKKAVNDTEDFKLLTLVTEEIVKKAAKNENPLKIKNGAIITPLAKDAIRELKVNVIVT